MVDLGTDVGLASDSNEFVDRTNHVRSLIAHVGDVDPVVLGCDF